MTRVVLCMFFILSSHALTVQHVRLEGTTVGSDWRAVCACTCKGRRHLRTYRECPAIRQYHPALEQECPGT
jgi:hypothetical protein